MNPLQMRSESPSHRESAILLDGAFSMAAKALLKFYLTWIDSTAAKRYTAVKFALHLPCAERQQEV